jgi:hypothetical protein
MIERALVRTLALWLALFPIAAQATQAELIPPTSGIYTGIQYSQKIGDAFRALAGCNKGPTAPANVAGGVIDGLCWIDDSGSPWIKKRYVNGGWAVEGALDPSNSTFAGVIGGGLATIASATGPVIDLGSVAQANVTISGTSSITGFGPNAPAGIEKTIRFDNALVLTPSVALLVPGGFPLTTAAGDRAKVTHLGSGNWEITQYTRANGIPVDVAAVGKPDFTFSESVPPLHVAAFGQAIARSAYPAYLAKATRAQNGTRAAGNATITAIANTAGLGAGMPVEATGVNAGCTIASVTSSSITLNSSACVTASGTSTVSVFLYGYGTGGSTTTVGVPDCRGRTLAGRDRNDPGAFANRLTASYFGQDSSRFGAFGGQEWHQNTVAEMAAHFHSAGISDPGHSHTTAIGQNNGVTGGSTFVAYTSLALSPSFGGINASNSSYSPATTSVATGVRVNSGNGLDTTNSTGSSAAYSIAGPILIAECVVRVTP